jgi:hypothetical protein
MSSSIISNYKNKDFAYSNAIREKNPYGIYPYNFIHDLSIRGIKILDISYIFIISALIGYIFARILSNLFPFNQESYTPNFKGKFKLAIEILLEFALIGVLIYIGRNLLEKIPFVFDGAKGINAPKEFKGFQHDKVKEVGDSRIIAFIIIMFQDSLRAKLAYFAKLTGF